MRRQELNSYMHWLFAGYVVGRAWGDCVDRELGRVRAVQAVADHT